SQPVQHLAPSCRNLPSPCPLLPLHRVYKNTEELRTRIALGIIAPLGAPTEKAKKEPEAEKKDPDSSRDSDPLRIPPRQPAGTRAPSCANLTSSAFPLLRGRSGGMIVDPLRSGFPQRSIDPSSGIPGRLPPGAVPPGARFDPFGPLGAGRARPDPNHLSPPGYDDMFM
ncbi:PSMF1 inhibitor, partial [Columbina picui]|nr:PSMF1 inhibitor [Columbina picui]